jgi:peptidyl-prolyl cis-trans isomerase C
VRFIRSTIALAALFAATSIQAAQPHKDNAKAQPAGSKDALIATVNGKSYSAELFRAFLAQRLEATQDKATPEFQAQVLDEFMANVVAAQEAEKRKLDERDDVKAALELQRLEVLSNATLQAMAQEEKVTDAEIIKAYDDFVANTDRTQYKARHILVKTKDAAEKVIKQLGKGADFGKLARESSIAPNAKDGGELGWVNANQLPKPLSDALSKLKAGSYAKEPVMTQFGWHVVELEDSRTAEPPSLDALKPQLTEHLKRQKAMAKLIKLRSNAMVEFNPDIVKTKPAGESDGKAASTPKSK